MNHATAHRLLAIALLALFAAVPVAAWAQGPKAPRPKREMHNWWNDETVVETLGLSEGTRSRMDSAYQGYQAAVANRSKNPGQRLEKALAAGDWDAARAAVEEMVAPTKKMGELKIEILQMLSEEQRTKLVKDYGPILRRNWRPAARWAAPRQGARPTQQRSPEP